jgi:hypothetical protein
MQKLMNIVAVTLLLVPAVVLRAQDAQSDEQVSQNKPVVEENKEDAQPYGKCSKGGCTKPSCKGGSCGR